MEFAAASFSTVIFVTVPSDSVLLPSVIHARPFSSSGRTQSGSSSVSSSNHARDVSLFSSLLPGVRPTVTSGTSASIPGPPGTLPVPLSISTVLSFSSEEFSPVVSLPFASPEALTRPPVLSVTSVCVPCSSPSTPSSVHSFSMVMVTVVSPVLASVSVTVEVVSFGSSGVPVPEVVVPSTPSASAAVPVAGKSSPTTRIHASSFASFFFIYMYPLHFLYAKVFGQSILNYIHQGAYILLIFASASHL